MFHLIPFIPGSYLFLIWIIIIAVTQVLFVLVSVFILDYKRNSSLFPQHWLYIQTPQSICQHLKTNILHICNIYYY